MSYQPEMNKELEELGRQIAKATMNWEAALAPMVKGFADLQKKMETTVKAIALPAFDMQKAFEAALAPPRKQIEAFQKAFMSSFESLSQSFEQLPPKIRDSLMILAENGWYLDPDLSIPAMFRLAEAFSPENADDANEALCDYFDSQVDAIESRLATQLPERSRLFSAAFEAHCRKEYALSIPVFLSQADGICHKITGEQLYSKNSSGMPKLATVLLTPDISRFSKSMLTPIIEPTPITANAKVRQQMPDNILNRHAILHGESTDYDNRLNSCRAISLLVYVAWILSAKE